MGNVNNKRVCASYRVTVSVKQVNYYKEVIRQEHKGTNEYCEARIALDHVIPEWLYNRARKLAEEIYFMEQILTATGHEYNEALDNVKRNLDNMHEEFGDGCNIRK